AVAGTELPDAARPLRRLSAVAWAAGADGRIPRAGVALYSVRDRRRAGLHGGLLVDLTSKSKSGCSLSRHDEERSDEAIHASLPDCFAEPVIGPYKARTRWLAMTLAPS